MKDKNSWLVVLSLFLLSIILLVFSSCDETTGRGGDFVLESLNGTDDYRSMDNTGTTNGGYPYRDGLMPD